MCNCYRIGGPFIAEDPDCYEHGTAAKEREQQTEEDARDAARYRKLKALHDQYLAGWHVRGDLAEPIASGGLDAALDAIEFEV